MQTKTVLLAVAVLMAAIPSSLTMADTFDLSAAWGDGSGTGNPNGPWSLNVGTTPMGQHYWLPSESAWLWDAYGNTYPSFAFETLNKWNDCHPGDIVFQGSPAGPNVSWTSPVEGLIDISGRTWDAYGGRGGAEWVLEINGTVLAQGTTPPNSRRDSVGVTFAENVQPGQTLTDVPVHVGDVVRLWDYGNTNGIEMTIVTPEPATLSLLALGGLVSIRRRRKWAPISSKRQ